MAGSRSPSPFLESDEVEEDSNVLSTDEEDDDKTISMSENTKKTPMKSKKPKDVTGIIYLSSVPDYMSVQRLRNFFSEYGEINRTFFQPVEKSYKYKKGLLFTEGWVEFRQRSDAKLVARALNNTQVGGKKRSPWSTCIWNIKFLRDFTWTDINADRELKKATHDSRIRADISQVKKLSHFRVDNFEKSQTLEKVRKKKEKRGQKFEERVFGEGIRQRLTDEEVIAQKKMKRKSDMSEWEEKSSKKQSFGDPDQAASHKFVMGNIFGKGS